MSRTPQPQGTRGSLRWIQQAVARPETELTRELEARLGSTVCWRSPLAQDALAEYRDAAALDLLGLGDHAAALAEFWPRRGPQWDALGLGARGEVILVEAKAHVSEMCSPPTAATGASRARIERALAWTAERLGATPRAPWTDLFYQYANHLAHLVFLRERGVPAWLVLASFVGDAEMGGPDGPEAWDAAYEVAHHVMELSARHPLSRYVLHLNPPVAPLAAP